MTMISFATYGDHAEFICDSTSYTEMIGQIGHCTKHLTMPHLDAAVLAQGDSEFGNMAKLGALFASGEVKTFDELTETAPDWLGQLWEERLAQASRERHFPLEGNVFMLGWSDTEGEFVAYVLAAAQNFKPLRVKSTWCMPMPFDYRPSGLELRLMKFHKADHPDTPKAAEIWSARPPLSRPQSVDEWVRLAQLVREQRTGANGDRYFNFLVAGDVFHTRLGRGEVTTRRVHRFNDTGEEFADVIAWTQHPQSLAASCWCESGQTFGECHGSREAIAAAIEKTRQAATA